jgi:outer membrane usher protein
MPWLLFSRLTKAFSSEVDPVRVKKTRQNNKREPPLRFNRNGMGSRLAFAAAMSVAGLAAHAQDGPAGEMLYLEVFINGETTGLIANFAQRSEGRLAIKVTEMRELRIRSDSVPAGPDGFVDLDRCSSMTYRYDQVRQVVLIQITDQGRLPFQVMTRPKPEPIATSAQAPGAVLNYTIFATSDTNTNSFLVGLGKQPNLSGSFEARLFSEYGVFSQSAIANSSSEIAPEAIRLDTTWSYSDPNSLTAFHAGDVISGGLSWTRSLRLGGAQIQRNFSLRPDLVTMPMPRFSGTAAVPSTVDVFVNSLKTYSGTVPAGPFQIQNLPVISGAGNQRIVVQDSMGRQTVVDQPFYSSSKMLGEGLMDFSAEAGFIRQDYGIGSFSYDKNPAASGSVRYGLNDWLTLEGHGETTNALLNAGAGVNLLLGSWGVASAAFAGSRADSNSSGILWSASLELGRGGYTAYARTQRTTMNYLDLASIPSTTSAIPGVSILSPRPSRELDQIALNVPLRFDPSSLTVSFTRLQDPLNNRNDILGLTYTRPLPGNASLFFSGFKDFANPDSYGFFGGISLSLGGNISASSSVSNTGSGTSGGINVNKSQSLDSGSWGWRVQDQEGVGTTRAAAVSYRSDFGRAEVGVQQVAGTTQATAQFDGAVAFVDGNTFFTNRIDDAFVVVDAGTPNVDVFYENRPIGTTGSSGVMLVPYLRAYQKNQVSIDPKNLAVDADVPSTRAAVVPADRGAVVVKFGVSENARNAVVVLKDGDGKDIPAGSSAHLAEGEDAVVGYGGEVYLKGLKDKNNVVVERAEQGPCQASFDYQPTPGERVVIRDVVCR